MILTFSKKIFEDRIKSGVKTHTIREDKHDRWKKGMKIHFWMRNPRNIKNDPYQFGEGMVYITLPIHIYPEQNKFKISNWGEYTDIDTLNELAENDGFDSWEEMKKWFKEEFHGKIIYWKDCKWI